MNESEDAQAVASSEMVGLPCEYLTVMDKWEPCEVRPTPKSIVDAGNIFIVSDAVRYTVPIKDLRIRRQPNGKVSHAPSSVAERNDEKEK